LEKKKEIQHSPSIEAEGKTSKKKLLMGISPQVQPAPFEMDKTWSFLHVSFVS